MLLKGPQSLDGAREHRGVLLESRDAAALRGHHGAKVVDNNLELRSAARELAESLLVQDDVLAHELQVVDHTLRKGLALATFESVDLRRDPVEPLGHPEAVGRQLLDLTVHEIEARVDLHHLGVERGLHGLELLLHQDHFVGGVAEPGKQVPPQIHAQLGMLVDLLFELPELALETL